MSEFVNNAQPRTDAVTNEDALHELADLCLDSCVSPTGPTAVGFTIEGCGATDDIVLWRKTVAGSDELIGFDAPGDWHVFGLVATQDQVPVVHLQHRNGPALTVFDGRDQVASGGRITDICCRVLGLSTAPVPYSSAQYFAQVWLEQCVLHALDHDNPSWDDLRDRFLFASFCHDASTFAGPSVDRAFRALGGVLAERYPWAILRRSFANESRQSHISPEGAAWMDDAMFARELLAERFPIHRLLDDLESMVRASVARSVREVLAAWGVDH